MTILCVGLNKEIEKNLALRLLAIGHLIKVTDDPEDIENAILYDDLELLIIDADSLPGDSIIRYLEKIKKLDQNNQCRKIIMSNRNNIEFIYQLMLQGVDGVVSKKATSDVIVDATISNLFSMSPRAQEKRKHIRVDIDKEEECTCTIPIANSDRILTGYLINISMGGALISINESYVDQYIKDNITLNNVQINLNKKNIICDIQVVVERNGLVGVKFTGIKESFKHYIAKYIFDKISTI